MYTQRSSLSPLQKELLSLIEGCAVSTRLGILNTDHVLFIAAGAFHKVRAQVRVKQGLFHVCYGVCVCVCACDEELYV